MASEKILAQKQAMVEELAQKLQASAAGVLVDYKGINVADDTKLRRELREAGVNYFVVKNTLLERAAEKVGFGELKEHLSGTSALAISEDQIAAARILTKYAEGSKGKFTVKAGFVDGGVIDVAGVEALAATPSKEVLIGKMMGSLMSSLYSFAYVLQAKIDKENGGEEAAEAPAEA